MALRVRESVAQVLNRRDFYRSLDHLHIPCSIYPSHYMQNIKNPRIRQRTAEQTKAAGVTVGYPSSLARAETLIERGVSSAENPPALLLRHRLVIPWRGGVGLVVQFDFGLCKVAVRDEVFVARLHLREAVARVEDCEGEDGEGVHAVGGITC